ncbi:MAG: virulence RhuM family protein [Kiritimatiellae bacterium]|nr:virulence RhuM family protein [Kiritimatiellia bacterium]
MNGDGREVGRGGEGGNEMVVYQPDETLRLEVRLRDETVWLTQEQIARLFGTQRPAIGKHLAHIYGSDELDEAGPCSILDHVGNDGKQRYRTKFYNLDAILAVGYRVNSRNASMFRRWATGVLKGYLLRGYAFSRRLGELEERVERRLAKHEGEIEGLKEKVEFFVRTSLPPVQEVFYDGQMWDARALADRLIGSARESLTLIDNWVTVGTLDLLAGKRPGVAATVVTSAHLDGNGRARPGISPGDVAKFNAQYPPLEVRFSEKFHDRFLVVDGKELYLIGASLKDLGKKCFAFTRLDAGEIPGLMARV